ncbi:hypothetical protein KZZ07_25380 [Mameliella sp. CS4]|uniref:DUF6527 family protein n=1 Tax=Mameliella sp. CS4 TaxID=2862329 RepID=UPI001C5E26E0|nr:DUF6527 family protein [Mameliella sp. CS4]MBW4985880.1 hypothetical protein [Mameliella sp. CS4]
MKATRIEHRFVDAIPETLEDEVLYVSIEFTTAVHKCLCGCGQEVVTPISPTDWKLTFDGETVSLDPSVGNWSFDCQSHYWIRRDTVRWAGQMSEEQIAKVREKDVRSKAAYFDASCQKVTHSAPAHRPGIFGRLARWIGLRRS